MLDKSSFTKFISKFKGGDSVMKKVLGLSLMLVLFVSMSFATMTQYSWLTTLGNNVAGGSLTNGAVAYNPVLDATFVGQYFTSAVSSRACILGWSMNPADPTYGTETPKYYIRERMFNNGIKVGGIRTVYGGSEYMNGKMYFMTDLWIYSSQNIVCRMYCPVNADSVSVTFPGVTPTIPLYNVTGVSSTASTAVEDTWGGVQLYAGSTTAFNSMSCGANGWAPFVVPGDGCMLGGVSGVWTDAYTAYTRTSTTSADNTTVFSPKTPLRVVTGVWTNAAGLGQNFYTGPGNSFIGGTGQITLNTITTLPTPAGGDSVWVSYGWSGLDNAGTPTGVGSSFYGSYEEPQRNVWPSASIPGAPRTVYVAYTLHQFDPNSGVIQLNKAYPQTPGTLLFTHVGQLQPGMRGMWVYDGTSADASGSLSAVTGFGTFGTPVQYLPCTVAAIYTAGAVTTALDVGVPPAYPVTDQAQVTRTIGGINTGRSRLGYLSYGTFTSGPYVSTSATQFTMDVQGKPYYGITGIYTNNPSTTVLGTNFWSSPTPSGWVAATAGQSKFALPGWLPIRMVYGIVTGGSTAFTREAETSVSGTVINTLKVPIVSCSGVWTNATGLGVNYAANGAYTRYPYTSTDASHVSVSVTPLTAVAGVWTNTGGLGVNYAANGAYTRYPYTSTDATTVSVTWLPLTAVTGVYTNTGGLGFNFYSGPSNTFTAGGVVTLNSVTTLSGAVPVWVSFSGGTAADFVAGGAITLNGNALPGPTVSTWVSFSGGTVATVSAPNVITLNGSALSGSIPVWSSYVIAGLDNTGTMTQAGTNFFTGRADALDTTSQIGAGGPAGWWSIAVDTPTIYSAVGGVDTTLSLGSVFVSYIGEPPQDFTPGMYNPIDTTGDIILTNPLPAPGTQVWIIFDRGDAIDVANNMIHTGPPAASSGTMFVGDTVYVSMMYQGGTNPYKFTGPGTAGNRAVAWNEYGCCADGAGNVFTSSLWSYCGWQAYDASGNLIARYPAKGSVSQVSRGQISCDTVTKDIYWEDGNGIVWRWKKTGATLDTYVQDNEPFYLGNSKGTNATALRGSTSALRVKNVASQLGGRVTLVYLATPRDNNGATQGTDLLTVMKTDGTVDGRFSTGGTAVAEMGCPRGMDVTPDGTKVMMGLWSGNAPIPELFVWSGFVVPVELSRFESLVD